MIPDFSSPAWIVAAYLVQQLELNPFWQLQIPGDGTTICYVDKVPDDSDQMIAVRDMPGMTFGRILRSGQTVSHMGIQIVVRALDYPTVYPLANSVCNALDSSGTSGPFTVVTPDTVDHYLQSIYRVGSMIDKGEEVGKRRELRIIHARVAFQYAEPNYA